MTVAHRIGRRGDGGQRQVRSAKSRATRWPEKAAKFAQRAASQAALGFLVETIISSTNSSVYTLLEDLAGYPVVHAIRGPQATMLTCIGN